MTLSVKALAFDTGGTILDWHRGISAALAKVGERRGLDDDWPAAANEYRRRALMGVALQVRPDFNIDDVHRRLIDELASERGWSAFTEQDRIEIYRAWHTLDCWPDFPAASERLRRRYVMASFTILSTALIIDTARHNGLNWDCVISCEMIGSYKTNPEAYTTCARWLGYQPDEILMVAAHDVDLLAARAVGFKSAFVRRPEEWGDEESPLGSNPDPSHDIVVDSFGDLATQLGC